MNSTLVIGGILTLVFILLIFGASTKPLQVIGKVFVKVMVGVVLLFAVNVIGTYFGFHIPINLGTASVSSVLGIPGICALVIIKLYIMPG
ncbi:MULTISPECIES: pro-sigmaK processing inhibitor BofA family protein [Bacillus cereus group]|uniref:Pro-sigmaK processing inhibitor BofA n=1 Tax=Bacillus cereus TaxID=1396 RepID=A0AA44QDM0_BACCE|nr:MULTISPECIES: pro-sigmaK processing inhibitor BofA family protein [Bacillus cereus group]EEL52611.1 SigmaK-factor processing regulatory protein BofA [Bacillus cereus Rock3-44]PFA14885.1 pro-sigmaK processing inhibitor BofA [Bacillus cereus]PFN07397.1 pro-sigmaK processing inhibitor BofA [Bacillus cereus]PFO78861.1 pro-sigmaK processing inhibitor BofA [Bacillus cereus]PFR20512.1 pro-sigmaK processing inhibitor BofA [Bacillus cereus]